MDGLYVPTWNWVKNLDRWVSVSPLTFINLVAYCLLQHFQQFIISWLSPNMGWVLNLYNPMKACQPWCTLTLLIYKKDGTYPDLEEEQSLFTLVGCIFSTEDSPHSVWGSMYSAKWLGEAGFFFLTMRTIIQAHKHIICMTHYTVWYVRQTQRRQWMLA